MEAKSFLISILIGFTLLLTCASEHFEIAASHRRAEESSNFEYFSKLEVEPEDELTIFESNHGRGRPSSRGRSGNGSSRQGRCFLPFVIIRVKDDVCNAKEANLLGTCMMWKKCFLNNGTKNGICAKGFGTCCTFKTSCGGRIIHNNTYFQSRNFPSGFQPNGVETCSVDILKRSSNICQVRLDFLSTNIEGGNNNGVCQIDRIQFYGLPDGVGTIPLNLCGYMDGQSMYVDFGHSTKIGLSFITDGNLSSKLRSWNVRTSYIECNTRFTAPNGCLQYYTGNVGQVKILGYPQSPHLGNLSYAVCIRAEEGARAISWSRCPQEPIDQSFWFTGGPFSTGPQAISTCNGDYVVIMSTLDPMFRLSDRYCGNTLVAPSATAAVTSPEKPFILRVKTDAIESPVEEGNTGFCLQWKQEF